MGLLLGYSILNLPSMILFCCGSIRKRILGLKTIGSNVSNDQTNDVEYSSSHLEIKHGRTLIPLRAINDENKKHNDACDANYNIMFEEFNRRLRSIEDQLI